MEFKILCNKYILITNSKVILYLTVRRLFLFVCNILYALKFLTQSDIQNIPSGVCPIRMMKIFLDQSAHMK